MNKSQIEILYQMAGMSSDAISKRFEQAQRLIHANSIGARTGKGGGVYLAGDSWNDEGSAMPIIAKDIAEADALVNTLKDSDTYQFNIPSSGIPQPLTTIWTSRMIEMLYKTRTLNEIAGAWQQGAPGVTDIKIPVMQYSGVADVYSDLSMNGSTSLNFNWVSRQIAYFEQSIVYGELQQAQFGLIKIDYSNRLREATAEIIAQAQNDIGFQGYTGIPSTSQPHIFGILNEPNLNAAISLPNDGVIPGTSTSTTAWMGKDFNQIVRDFRLIIAQALSQAEGHATLKTKGKFGLPPSSFAALTTPNPISSVTVLQYMKEAYPNIEFVMIPNFEASMVTTGTTTNQTVGMLLFQHPNGEMPYDELFVTKWQGHRPVPMGSAINEKISYALGGALLKYPFLVTYCYGI